MMVRSLYGVVLLIITALTSPGFAEQSSRVGKRVLPRHGDVKLYAAAGGAEVKDLGTLFQRCYRVQAESQGWLQFRQRGVKGWCSAADVVPVEQALDFFA